MLRIFRIRSINTNKLLDSRLYDERTFYGSFTKDINHAKQSIIIESPFLTERRAAQFCKQFKKLHDKGVKVRVNTRLPYHHDTILLQVQGWRAARLLKANGVKVCFYKDMRHRKLAVIDGCILWEGSLNILSQSYSKEMMRRTVSKSLSRQMLCFTGADRWHW
ncbi:hypothetical protein BH09PAT4_BH09PAT4_09470 [soil metagenome]